MGRRQTRLRRIVAAGALVALALGPLLTTLSPAGANLASTPRDRALVVTANLDEAFGDWDAAHLGDMRAFVRRLPKVVPYVPDVLLLQEVRRRTAIFIAHALSNWYGRKFVVAVGPGTEVWTLLPHQVVTSDTAILLNTASMFRQSRGGFLTSSYLRRAAAPTVPRVTKREAYVLAARREGNFRMTLSSLHFVPEFDLRSRYLSNFYRSKWSREAAASLRWRFPDRTAGHLFVIGGDFNSPRCLNRIAANCRRAPFWRTLTSRYRMYDAMYTYGRVAGHSNVQTNAGVDYIFSTGSVFAAGSDATYTKQVRRQPGRFYSDHQFYWALVGPATRP